MDVASRCNIGQHTDMLVSPGPLDVRIWADTKQHSTVEPVQAWGSRGRGFESRRPDIDGALTSGNTGRGFDFCLCNVKAPPKTPRKLGSAARVVIDAHR